MEQTCEVMVYAATTDGTKIVDTIRPFTIQPSGKLSGKLSDDTRAVKFNWAYGQVSSIVADSVEQAELIVKGLGRCIRA
jgi:hypothetical protein